jgi:hypothetical protein
MMKRRRKMMTRRMRARMGKMPRTGSPTPKTKAKVSKATPHKGRRNNLSCQRRAKV